MAMPVALSIAPGDAVRGFLSAHIVMRKQPGMTKRGMSTNSAMLNSGMEFTTRSMVSIALRLIFSPPLMPYTAYCSSVMNTVAADAKIKRKATIPMPILANAGTGPPLRYLVAAECFQFQLVSVWAESMTV